MTLKTLSLIACAAVPAKQCRLNRSMQQHLIEIILLEVVLMRQGRRHDLAGSTVCSLKPAHALVRS
jgi:hypothetical protein